MALLQAGSQQHVPMSSVKGQGLEIRRIQGSSVCYEERKLDLKATSRNDSVTPKRKHSRSYSLLTYMKNYYVITLEEVEQGNVEQTQTSH